MALMPVWSGSFTGWRCDDARRLELDRAVVLGLDRAAVVERVAERVHDAAEERLAHRHLDDAAGAAHLVALLDERVVAQEHGADVVLLEVQREAGDPVRRTRASRARRTTRGRGCGRCRRRPARTVPTSSTSTVPEYCSIWPRRTFVISSGRSFICEWPLCSGRCSGRSGRAAASPRRSARSAAPRGARRCGGGRSRPRRRRRCGAPGRRRSRGRPTR